MSWLCKNCETINDDNDCKCVVCNSVPPDISEITVDYQKELITWTNKDVCELLIKYSQGTYSATGLTSFHIVIRAAETIEFIARNDAAERTFRYKLSYTSVQKALKLKKEVEENIWLQAFRHNSIEAFKDYLNAYPDGPHAEEAKKKISEFEDDNSWKVACAKNTLQAYQNYEKKHSSGRHIVQCKRLINEINDNKAWRKALDENSLESYNAYLRRFTSPIHASEAREKIEGLSRSSSVWGWIAAVVIIIIIAFFSLNELGVISFPSHEDRTEQIDNSPPDSPGPSKPDYSSEIRKLRKELEDDFSLLEDTKSYNPEGGLNVVVLKHIRDNLSKLRRYEDPKANDYQKRLDRLLR